MPNTALKVNAAAVDPGNTEYGRATVTRSNGVVYIATYNSDAKIHIYEVSADRLTVTDRIAITPSSSEVPKRICLGLFQSDNSIAVGYQSSDVYNVFSNQVRYCKVNSTTWAAPTWESVAGSSGASAAYWDFDLDISDTGMPVVALIVANSVSSVVNVYARGTTGGTWVQAGYTPTLIGAGGAPVKVGHTISVQCIATSASQRDVVFAAGAAGATPKTDGGVGIYALKFTETTGAYIASSGAKKTTIMTATIKNADIPTTTSGLDKKMRHVKVFRCGNASTNFDVAGMSASTKSTHYYRGSISAGTLVTQIPETLLGWTSKSWASMGLTYGVGASGATVFQVPSWYVKDTAGIVWMKTIKVNADNVTVGWRGGDGRAYGGLSTQTVSTLSDNAAPYPSVTDQDNVLTVNDSVAGSVTIYDNYAGFPTIMPGSNSGITSLAPATGTVNLPAHPTFVATLDTDQKYGSGPYLVDFQVASDAGFTTSVQDQIAPFAAGVSVDGTDTPGVVITFADSPEFSLSKATWFYRARLMDMWGIFSGWFSGGSFTVGHPPSAVPKTPVSGGYYIWNGGVISCSWDFTDPSPGDTQSAYQVQIIDASGTVIQDTGKVISTVQTYTTTALSGVKDTQLKWQVRLWDSTDTVGAYSTPQQFVMTDPPTVAITTPSTGAVATTGVPSYIFTVTTGGGRTITGYQILVTSGSQVVYSGPVVAISVTTGASVTAKMPPNYLQNNGGYSVQVTIQDSAGMVGVSPVISFTTLWTPPATPGAITVDTSNYDVETLGYIQISWPDTGRAAGFTHWTVYRKDDLIDPNTGTVIQAGTFQPIFQDYDTGTLYVFNDYVAPSNQYKSTYAVTQWINSLGQDMESLMSAASPVVPTSAAYWLINPDTDANTADTVRLTIVTDDSFTEEQEEAEFTIIGRGRVVNRGQYLGPKGSMTARLRNTGSTTARQKRQNLLNIQQESGTLLIRNPFGDVWAVNMSNMQVDRIAGVGTAEFCDVTLPYAEVS